MHVEAPEKTACSSDIFNGVCVCVYVCVCVCECHLCVGAHRGKKRALEFLELQLHMAGSLLMWVLRITVSSGRIASALNL